jgi:hypothetical protein
MAYTLGITLFDVGGIYPAGTPSLTGILNAPPTAPATAVSSPAPFSISFAGLPSPPAGAGTLYVGDPTGPGDFFRSGPIGSWPPAPASINVLTIPTTPVAAVPGFPGVGRFSYSAIKTLLFPAFRSPARSRSLSERTTRPRSIFPSRRQRTPLPRQTSSA